MVDPGTALLIAVAVLGAAAVFFWPNYGLLWAILRGYRSTQRVLIEDALKHFYDLEEKGHFGTLESLSGALSISRDRAAHLVARLQELHLLRPEAHGFKLEPEGRSYALRVIRIHRLWEKYLADETSLPEVDWHREAEIREHQLSHAEAEAMAAQLGHPQYDPHGDPIPSSSGELPPRRGIPLTDLPIDELAMIIHIEDEPEVLYRQIIAVGLHPGKKVLVTTKSSERIVFIADGEEVILAPVVASNISVEPLPREQEMEGPYETLDLLRIGEQATVIGISRACRGLQRRRLMDLGVVPGTVVTAERRSASGDPTAYSIRGATIALRKDQARFIHIKRNQETTNGR